MLVSPELTNTIALIVNGVTIALALFMLILLLWQESGNAENLLFGLLMLMLVIWSAGALLARSAAYVGGADLILQSGLRVLELGFTGSCGAIYLFAVVLSGARGRSFWRLTIIPMIIVPIYALWLIISTPLSSYDLRSDGLLRYEFYWSGAVLYVSLIVSALMIAWRRRYRINDKRLLAGVTGFCAGMLIELISPELHSRSIGLDISAISALVISLSMVRMQVIEPLRGRAKQLRAVRDVGLAITSRVSVEDVLSTIAGQAAWIMQADGAAIFLNRGDCLELAAVHNMPQTVQNYRLAPGEGLAGQVAVTRISAHVEDYRRDWTGYPDMPFAKQLFGAVIAAPLIFADEVMGVLVVVKGVYGKRFDDENVRLLDLLSPQAAVAIKNSRLFERQTGLTSELEAAKNQLETVLTSTENPVIALNRRYEIIFANPAAERLLKCGRLTGRRLLDVAPPDVIPSKPYRALRQLGRNGSYTYEMTAGKVTFMCHVALLAGTTTQGYVAMLNDVSQLKEIDQIKNRMIHMTSHDLKNPLSAAMFHIELLQEEGDGILTEAMTRDINTIWVQLQRMNRIINGILGLERVRNTTLTYEDCAVDQILTTAIQELASQASRKAIKLDINIPDDLPAIPCNRQQLSQAFSNVIDNAIKFTPENGQVRIHAEAGGGCINIDIADSGIGIASEDQPRIFEQFFRGTHPGTEQLAGSGLGLSLVKAVIDAHQGRVWLESTVNAGTVIHMALPVRHVN